MNYYLSKLTWLLRSHHYEVILFMINVKCGAIFPWFNEEGGGTRIVLPMPIKDLEAGGYIVRVS